MSEETKPQISFDQFLAVDLRVAKVLEATEHPNADKLMVLTLDLGPLGQRQIIAGIKQHYHPEDLVGKHIAVVANLAPRMMRGMESQGMLLAGVEGQPATNIVVLELARPVEPGAVIS